MAETNRQVVLAARPGAEIIETDFALREAPAPTPGDGQFVLANRYLSMDAGFRQWMNEGADDNYLSAMALNAPVQSIVLGEVVASRNPQFPEGTVLMARSAWERFSLLDGSDIANPLTTDPAVPMYEYLAALGPGGLTAYFGILDIGRPKADDDVLVTAAGCGVGAIAGQIAKIHGCRVVGTAGSTDKARWLCNEVGYDQALDYKAAGGLGPQLAEAFSDGIEPLFDNVGGRMLDTCLMHLAEGARIVLCGAVSQYGRSEGHEGIHHLWELVTKRASCAGFMFSDYAERFGEAIATMTDWIKAGKLASPVSIYRGIERTPQAFVDMLAGRTRGKTIVEL